MGDQEWIETTATVYSCGWEDTPGHWLLSPGKFLKDAGHYVVVFRYTVDGNHHSGEFTSQREWEEKSTFQLKYNFRNPEENDRAGLDDSGPVMTIASWVGGAALVAIYLWWKYHK